MKRKMMGLGLILVVVGMLAAPVATLAAGGPPNGRGQGNGGVAQPAAAGSLTAEQQAALVDFWTDEHKALATYQAVMAQFGAVPPFSMIARAEQNHIAALERIFARYGITVPATPTFETPVFATLGEACAAAAQAEIDNAALYDELQAQFTQPDILRVLDNLRNASLNNHLPAFEACVAGTCTGDGSGGTQGNAGASARNGGQGNLNAPRDNAQYATGPVAQQ